MTLCARARLWIACFVRLFFGDWGASAGDAVLRESNRI